MAIENGVPKSELVSKEDAAFAKQFIQREFLKAEVYYRTLNVKVFEEQPKYTVSKKNLNGKRKYSHGEKVFQTEAIVSALGGALGLYLGVAIILVFEFIELAGLVIVNLWRGNKKH